MFLGVAEYGREKVKSRPVGDQLALKVENRMPFRYLQKFMNLLICPYCPDALLPAFNLNLVCPAQNIKKRLIFEPPVAKPGQVDVR